MLLHIPLTSVVLGLVKLVSGLKRDMSRAVLKDLVSHPATVHPAVYTVIAIGSVNGFTVVCVIA